MAESENKHTLFTALEGVVTLGSSPVSGVRVVQTAKLGASTPQIREVRTDEAGRFTLAQVDTPKGPGSLLPQQFTVGQEIIFHHEGEEYVGWIATKFDPKPGTETGDNPIRLVCELSADTSGGETHVGVCRLVAE